jgi:hypothetical protein
VTYEVDPIFRCWLWTGKTDRRDGRAIVWRGKTPVSAQRAVYEEHVGPIPQGLELDHTCRNPACVRPAHAEPITRRENERRKTLRYRSKLAKCKKGHPLGDAMVTPQGGRLCRQCSMGAAP